MQGGGGGRGGRHDHGHDSSSSSSSSNSKRRGYVTVERHNGLLGGLLDTVDTAAHMALKAIGQTTQNVVQDATHIVTTVAAPIPGVNNIANAAAHVVNKVAHVGAEAATGITQDVLTTGTGLVNQLTGAHDSYVHHTGYTASDTE